MGKMERIKELEEMARNAVKELNKDAMDVFDDTNDGMIEDIFESGRGLGFVRYELVYGLYTMDLEVRYIATFDGDSLEMSSWDSVVYLYTSDEDQELGINEVESFEIDFRQ